MESQESLTCTQSFPVDKPAMQFFYHKFSFILLSSSLSYMANKKAQIERKL